MDTPTQVIIAAFSDEEEAGRLLADLKAGRRAGLIGIVDAAAVVKEADGKLRITNAKHRGRRGLVTGGAVGALIGLLAGPVGWGAVAGGGALGALTGRLRGAPLRAELTDLAESLTPGSSALLAVVEHTWVDQLAQLLAEDAARVVREELKADIATQLTTGGSVVFTAGSDGDAAGMARIATDADGRTEVAGFLTTAEGIVVTAAELSDEPLPAGEDT